MNTKRKILITGGGGFVGTQVSYDLVAAGHDVTIVDRAEPRGTPAGLYITMDYLDYFHNTDVLDFDTVIHLAADHLVEQSVTSPQEYYANNVIKMKGMLDAMDWHGIKNIIFSSSGNIYGRQGSNSLLTEDLYYDPENPYASTKVAGELLIKDYAKAYGMNYVVFRYFNAGGADPQARFGYVQRPATHVIPILCNKILSKTPFDLYGTDYPTRDGTCVRDYIHVADLARAHVLALELFSDNHTAEIFNIGGGKGGVSVKELVVVAGEVVGETPVVNYMPRRAGDPAMLTADVSKAKEYLGWVPEYSIRDMIQHAYNWELKHDIS